MMMLTTSSQLLQLNIPAQKAAWCLGAAASSRAARIINDRPGCQGEGRACKVLQSCTVALAQESQPWYVFPLRLAQSLRGHAPLGLQHGRYAFESGRKIGPMVAAANDNRSHPAHSRDAAATCRHHDVPMV